MHFERQAVLFVIKYGITIKTSWTYIMVTNIKGALTKVHIWRNKFLDSINKISQSSTVFDKYDKKIRKIQN